MVCMAVPMTLGISRGRTIPVSCHTADAKPDQRGRAQGTATTVTTATLPAAVSMNASVPEREPCLLQLALQAGCYGRGQADGKAGGEAVSLNDCVAALTERHGLVVIAGPAGSGRTTALRRLVNEVTAVEGATPGGLAPLVCAGGGLASLRAVPGAALARALRAAVPTDDPELAIEAARTRVRHGLLVLDDLQWADAFTIALVPRLVKFCRVAVTMRTPSGLDAVLEEQLQAAADVWTTTRPLTDDEAKELALITNPQLREAAVREILRRAGGLPLAVRSLAIAARSSVPQAQQTDDGPYVVAQAVAALHRPARTAIALLGLLGRPASPAILGDGVAELVAAGWVHRSGPGSADVVSPVSPYVAQIAASLVPETERAVMHERLASLTETGLLSMVESAQHWAAAGATERAYEQALAAADAAQIAGERAAMLLLAAKQSCATKADRVSAAAACVAAGRPRAALRVLDELDEANLHVSVLRGEALLQLGKFDQCLEVVSRAVAGEPRWRAELLRVYVFAAMQRDPRRLLACRAEIAELLASDEPAAFVADAVLAVGLREERWRERLRDAARRAVDANRPLDAWWCGWLLVVTLVGDGEVVAARGEARRFAQQAAQAGVYGWQTRFLAVELWCGALAGTGLDAVIERAFDVLDHALPGQALPYALSAAALALADSGSLSQARSQLDAVDAKAWANPLLSWVDAEVSWLDGQPAKVPAAPDPCVGPGRFGAALHGVTLRWAAADMGSEVPFPANLEVENTPTAPVATLRAWRAGDSGLLAAAAQQWRGVAAREEIRCLLAAGLIDDVANEDLGADADSTVTLLLAAEAIAADAGLVVLLGRARRMLRQRAVHRAEPESRRRGKGLTAREKQVLELVAEGEPTRRIAGRLGISRMTVETHVRSGMRKVGARTRTEAAALLLGERPELRP